MSGAVTKIDPRLLTAGVQIGSELVTFDQNFEIKARGVKFANALQNECDIEIVNMNKAHRDYLLTESSPFNSNRTPKLVTLSAGRVSTGLFSVYIGDVMTVTITQPPDIGLKLKCGTSHFKKGSVGRRSGGKVSTLSTIATGVASNLGLSLRNEAPEVNVSNYAHSGNALAEVDTLGKAGNCQCYVDDQHLILKKVNSPLSGSVLNLSENTGMIGIPELTEQGLKVKFLFDGSVKLGGAVNVTSKLNPAANGYFVIFKLGFDLTSRDVPFYYEAECQAANL